MAEMDDSVVGACPPGRADDHRVCRLDSLPAEMDSRHHPEDGGTFRHSPARPPQKPCFGGWSEGGFDAAALHAQLADLLQLYLARASQPDAVEKCSAKDAIACAKTLTAMMSDVQSGKPASVDADTQWPRLESSSVGRGPVPRRLHNAKFRNGGPRFGSAQRPELVEGRVAALQPESTSIRTLEDAVAIVCNSDEETQILEPWARLLARIEKLCTETQKRLDDAQSGAADDLIDEPVAGGAAACPPQLQRRRGSPVIPPKKSRAGAPACTFGGADKPGGPNEGFTAPAGDIAPGLPNEGSPAPSPNPSSLTPVASSPSDNRPASRAPPAR